MSEAENSRGSRKSRTGEVVSKSGDKSVVVIVERRYPHPVYGKVLKGQTKCYVHDAKNEAKVGDKVKIVESRPISKLKRWRLAEVLGQKSENV